MSVDLLIYQLATSLGITSNALKKDMIKLPEGMVQFPNLKPYIGEHFFRCMVVKHMDMDWMVNIAWNPRKAFNDPIFQTFRKCLDAAPEAEHEHFVLYVHTAGRACCIYRATSYAGQGAAIIRVGDDPLLYVIEPYESWLAENAGRWREDGNEPVFE
jgi:hypothetical protein